MAQKKINPERHLATKRPVKKKKSRQEKWRDRNPLKTWAHSATQSGLRRGLIHKQPCEICGAEKAEAHHDDYLRPLAVRWLCRAHHRQVHYPRKRES